MDIQQSSISLLWEYIYALIGITHNAAAYHPAYAFILLLISDAIIYCILALLSLNPLTL